MASVNLTHVNNDTHQIVSARSLKIRHLATVPTAATVSVGKHVQLEGEIDGFFNLGRRPVVPPLLILKSLGFVSLGLKVVLGSVSGDRP